MSTKIELFTLDRARLPHGGAPYAPTSGNLRVLIANRLWRRGILSRSGMGLIFDSPKKGNFQDTIIGYYLSKRSMECVTSQIGTSKQKSFWFILKFHSKFWSYLIKFPRQGRSNLSQITWTMKFCPSRAPSLLGPPTSINHEISLEHYSAGSIRVCN